jgi:hypothetical protein
MGGGEGEEGRTVVVGRKDRRAGEAGPKAKLKERHVVSFAKRR